MSSPKKEDEEEGENSDPPVSSPVENHLAEKVMPPLPAKRGRRAPKPTIQVTKRIKLEEEEMLEKNGELPSNEQNDDIIIEEAKCGENDLEIDKDSTKGLGEFQFYSKFELVRVPSDHVWGYLISQSSSKKNVSLTGKSFIIGKGGSNCNLPLETTQVENICEISINSENNVILKCNSNTSPVFLNRNRIVEGQSIVLESGDVLGIFGKKRYVFFFTTKLFPNMHPPESERDDQSSNNNIYGHHHHHHHAMKPSDRLGVLTRSMARRSSSLSPPAGNVVLKEEDSQDKLLIKQLTEEFTSKLIQPDDINVTFSNFPYYLSEELRDTLLYNSFMFLRAPTEYLKFVENLPNVSKKFLLCGPSGTETYQEMLVKALAKHFQAKLFIMNAYNFSFESISTLSTTTKDPIFKRKLHSSAVKSVLLKKHLTHSLYDDLLRNKHRRQYPLPLSSPIPTHIIPPRNKLSSRGVDDSTPTSNSSTSNSNNNSHSQYKHQFKLNDRVQFTGFKTEEDSPVHMCHECPEKGAKGRIAILFDDNPKRFGVRFDNKIKRGGNLGGLCEKGFGAILELNEIEKEKVYSGPPSSLVCQAIVNVVTSEQNYPCILFIKDAVLKHPHLSAELQLKLKLNYSISNVSKSRVLVIGSSILPENKQDKLNADMGVKSLSLDMSFLDQFRLAERPRSSVPKHRSKFFPQTITIPPPTTSQAIKEWKRMVEMDSQYSKYTNNVLTLKQFLKYRNILCSIPDSPDENSPLFDPLSSKIFTPEEVERIVGISILRRIKQLNRKTNSTTTVNNTKIIIIEDRNININNNNYNNNINITSTQNIMTDNDQIKPPLRNVCNTTMVENNNNNNDADKLVIGVADIHYAVQLFQKLKYSQLSALSNTEPENEFEKKLLQEVIPANQVGVHFEDIGALDHIKETLFELVILPLQRPELFRTGNLTKPCKGILLFGPPGTGKTMLAKAIAKESGANFLNINISSITSKWFGEGEKFARAVFTLASKIAPCVIFIDEVDSLLSKRDNSGEHEAMRKIKNEFMQMWDGLRTNETERVLVLAATNRPFDLDDAVLRRLPKRMLVDLPDVQNREKIIRVVLSKERLSHPFNYQAIAEKTEGYSGSDLKNLCIAAAYIPIREYLKMEKDLTSKGVDVDIASGPSRIRPILEKDFDEAMKEMSASVSENAFAISELRKWNDMYGEGGRGRISLSYFM